MSFEEKLSSIRELLAKRDEIDRELENIIGRSGSGSATAKSRTPLSVLKRREGKRDPQVGNRHKVDSDLMKEASNRHPATEQVERMLIEGAAVAEIIEKIEISAPTVYVIKSRLKSEGKLPE